jgi:hypothetical protein
MLVQSRNFKHDMNAIKTLLSNITILRIIIFQIVYLTEELEFSTIVLNIAIITKFSFNTLKNVHQLIITFNTKTLK